MTATDGSARTAPGVAEVRLSGTCEDTDALLALLEAAGAVILSKSAGYLNRRQPGRRVYALVQLPREDPHAVRAGQVMSVDGRPVDVGAESGAVRLGIGAGRILLPLDESDWLGELLPIAYDLAEQQQITAEEADLEEVPDAG